MRFSISAYNFFFSVRTFHKSMIIHFSFFPGSSQSNMWDPLVPSKKRTGVPRPKPTRVEQLTKDLYTILHETPLSSLSAASEEDLVYPAETLNPMDSTDSIEIGSGSILILNSNSKSKSKLVEEESEASSVPTDVKGPCVTPPNRGERNGVVHLSCMNPDEKGKRSGAPFVEVKPKTRYRTKIAMLDCSINYFI